MDVHPRWARLIGLVWVGAGVAMLVAGIVVVVDQHRWLRWEFVAGVVFLAVGWLLWRRRVSVDEHGIEELAGRRRSRTLWSSLERVAVGEPDRRGGPVRVWRPGDQDGRDLPASWGLSTAQQDALRDRITDLAGPHGVRVEDPPTVEAPSAD